MNYSASWRSKKVLFNIGCHTFNTRANRIVIVSSVITKIFNPVQVLDCHIQSFLMILSFYQCLLVLLLVPVSYCSVLFSAIRSVICYSVLLFIIRIVQ
jgi:hypothetical protein